MDSAMPGAKLNEEQLEAFRRYLASNGVHLRCPYCGSDYRPTMFFVSVPVVRNDQMTPATWPHPLVQVECENCAHVAQFNVPLPTPDDS